MRKRPTKVHSPAASEEAERRLRERVRSVAPPTPAQPNSETERPTRVITVAPRVPVAFEQKVEDFARKTDMPPDAIKAYLVKQARQQLRDLTPDDFWNEYGAALQSALNRKRGQGVPWLRFSLTLPVELMDRAIKLGDPLGIHSQSWMAGAIFETVLVKVPFPKK